MKENASRFRVAPHNLEKRSENLDAMVVIPAYDEGLNVLDTIHTAVMQEKKKDDPLSYGITVVINAKPDAEQRVKESNFNTYLLLQALEHRFPASLRGKSEFNKKIKEIAASGVPIHVVDTFSSGYASEQNNVGRARKLGTEYALPRLRDTGFIVSTDADTKLGPLLMESTKLFFEMSDYSAVELQMSRDTSETTDEEKHANAANSLYWDLRGLSSHASNFEDSLIWMSGGGSAFQKSAYEKIGGYREIAGEEDTFLGIDMSDQGLKVTGVDNPNLSVITRGRFSERASTGLGRSILKWSRSAGPFHEIKVPSFESVANMTELFKFIGTVFEVSLRTWCEGKGLSNKEFNLLHSMLFSSESRGDKRVEAFLNDPAEQERRHTIYTDALKVFNIPSPRDTELLEILSRYRSNEISSSVHHDLYKKSAAIFKSMHPDQTVKDFIDTLEDKTLAYEAKQREHEKEIGFTSDVALHGQTYENLKDRILSGLRITGLDLNNEEVSTKVRISILSAYRQYQHEVVTAVGGFTAQKEAEEKLATEPAPESIDVLSRVKFPQQMLDLVLENGFLKAQLRAVAHAQHSMVYEIPREVDDALKSEFDKLMLEYKKFLGDKFLPYMEEINRANVESIELFKKYLEKQGEIVANE